MLWHSSTVSELSAYAPDMHLRCNPPPRPQIALGKFLDKDDKEPPPRGVFQATCGTSSEPALSQVCCMYTMAKSSTSNPAKYLSHRIKQKEVEQQLMTASLDDLL